MLVQFIEESIVLIFMKSIRQNYIYIITLLFICSSLFSCQSSMTPLQVSEKFWEGIKKKNISLITIYSRSDSGYSIEAIQQLPDVTAITFGRIIIDADIAEIDTQVTIMSGEKTIDIPEEALRNKIPEFKNMLDEFLEGLKRSLEKAVPPKEEEAKTQQT